MRLGADGSAEIVDVAEVGEDALLVHDAHAAEPTVGFALARLGYPRPGPLPIGILRDVERPVNDEPMADQLESARRERGAGDLDRLLHSGDTREIAR